MLLAATCRVTMLTLVGVLKPTRVCSRNPDLCNGIVVVVPAVAFCAAWASSMLVLLFLSELRLAYMSVLRIKAHTQRKRALVIAYVVIGCVVALTLLGGAACFSRESIGVLWYARGCQLVVGVDV